MAALRVGAEGTEALGELPAALFPGRLRPRVPRPWPQLPQQPLRASRRGRHVTSVQDLRRPKGTSAGHGYREVVDARCRQRTAPWVREERRSQGLPSVPDIEDLSGCFFYEKYDRAEQDSAIDIPQGPRLLSPLDLTRRRCVHVE